VKYPFCQSSNSFFDCVENLQTSM